METETSKLDAESSKVEAVLVPTFSIEQFLHSTVVEKESIPSYVKFLTAWGLRNERDLSLLTRDELKAFAAEYRSIPQNKDFVLLPKDAAAIYDVAQSYGKKRIGNTNIESTESKKRKTVDWNDPSSILEFLRSNPAYVLQKKSQQVVVEGASLPLLHRTYAAETLWTEHVARFGHFKNFNSERTNHPINVFAGAPGTGKSRMLQDFVSVLKNQSQGNFPSCPELVEYLEDCIEILVTFTNGCDYGSVDETLSPVTSVAIRCLYAHFIDYKTTSFLSFQKDLILNGCKTIDFDTIVKLIKLQQPNVKSIYLGIDEFQRLLKPVDNPKEKRSNLTAVVQAVGQMLCHSHTYQLFFMASFAGTCYTEIESVISQSAHPKTQIPLHLLTMKEQEQVIDSLGLNVEWKTCDMFRRILADMGGLPRALESFVVKLKYFKNTLNLQNVTKWNYNDFADAVQKRITKLYAFSNYGPCYPDIIICSILRKPVARSEHPKLASNAATWGELESYGNVMLELKDGQLYVNLPFIILRIIISYLPQTYTWELLQEMLSYGQERIYWQQWEDFNCGFEALRAQLFLEYNETPILASKFYMGATFSKLDDYELPLSTTHVFFSTEQWPKGAAAAMCYTTGRLLTDCLKNNDLVAKNVYGAVCDIFHSFYFGKDRSKCDIVKDFRYTLGQTKHKEPYTVSKPQPLTLTTIKGEYDKCQKAMSEFGVENFLLVVFTNKNCDFEVEDLPPNVLLVSKSNFSKYYSPTYASCAHLYCGTVLNINRLDFQELRSVKGIGKLRAGAIITERSKGHFVNIADAAKRLGWTEYILEQFGFTYN